MHLTINIQVIHSPEVSLGFASDEPDTVRFAAIAFLGVVAIEVEQAPLVMDAR